MSESKTKALGGLYAKAEAGTRHATLMVGLGVVAYFVGGFLMAGVFVRFGDLFRAAQAEWLVFTLSWLLRRTWLFVVLPVFMWAAGRLLSVSALGLAITAVAAGEFFDLMIELARAGLEGTLPLASDVVARVVTLAMGVALALAAVQRGQRAGEAASERAKAKAAASQTEYDEFLRRARGGEPASPSLPEAERVGRPASPSLSEAERVGPPASPSLSEAERIASAGSSPALSEVERVAATGSSPALPASPSLPEAERVGPPQDPPRSEAERVAAGGSAPSLPANPPLSEAERVAASGSVPASSAPPALPEAERGPAGARTSATQPAVEPSTPKPS